MLIPCVAAMAAAGVEGIAMGGSGAADDREWCEGMFYDALSRYLDPAFDVGVALFGAHPADEAMAESWLWAQVAPIVKDLLLLEWQSEWLGVAPVDGLGMVSYFDSLVNRTLRECIALCRGTFVPPPAPIPTTPAVRRESSSSFSEDCPF